jgi:hypothetical protein
MDFRAIAPEAVSFKKGKTVVAKGPEGRITVQIPECPCTVRVHSPGTYRIDLKVPSSPAHDAFVEWVEAVEVVAARSDVGLGGLTRSSTVYTGYDGTRSVRLMAFSDTLVFDDRGELSADIRTAKKCIALVDLSGAWATDAKWGLRWKVTQLKFWNTCDGVPPRDEPCMF